MCIFKKLFKKEKQCEETKSDESIDFRLVKIGEIISINFINYIAVAYSKTGVYIIKEDSYNLESKIEMIHIPFVYKRKGRRVDINEDNMPNDILEALSKVNDII